MSVGEIAAQLNATKGAAALRESRWIVLATTSLPVPLCPVTRTGAFETATRRMASKTLTIGRRLADELAQLSGLLELGAQRVDLGLERAAGRETLEHDLELRRPQRLEQIVGHPGAQGLDRAVERRLAGDHDAVALGIRLAGGPKDLEAVAVGQVQVHDQHLGIELLHGAARLARRADGLRRRAEVAERALQAPADRDVVLDDEHSHAHGFNSSARPRSKSRTRGAAPGAPSRAPPRGLRPAPPVERPARGGGTRRRAESPDRERNAAVPRPGSGRPGLHRITHSGTLCA